MSHKPNKNRKKKRHKFIDFIDKNPFLGKLVRLFKRILKSETSPTQCSLLIMILSIIYQKSCTSIRSMFNNFIRKFSDSKLSTQYWTLNKGKIFIEE